MNEAFTSVKIHRGDDTESFNGGLFKIAYTNNSKTITRMELHVGEITKLYNLPQFPLQIDFSSVETSLNRIGEYPIEIVIYDSNLKRLNIQIDAMVEFVELSDKFKIPYESPVLFDFDEIFPLESASGICGESASWTLMLENNELVINGNGSINNPQWKEKYSEQIKSIIVDEGIDMLMAQAFTNCPNVESITLPSTITSGTLSFYVVEPDKLKEIKLNMETVVLQDIKQLVGSKLANLPEGGVLHLKQDITDIESLQESMAEIGWSIEQDL